MAAVEIVDLREDFRRTHSSAPISQSLHAAMARELAANRQSIVLINRRGYSWFALCRSCGASVLCENCSIALTYHKKRRALALPLLRLFAPGSASLPEMQFGAHLLRRGRRRASRGALARAFSASAHRAPRSRYGASQKARFAQVLGAFGAGKIDILVGTQMVAKGHDFHGVTLVGVVSADAQLGFPDFPRGREDISATDPGGRARRARHAAGARDRGEPPSGALRDSVGGEPGLCLVLREGAALPASDALPAFCRAGECAGDETPSWRTPFAGPGRSEVFFEAQGQRRKSGCWGRRRLRWRG